MVNAATRRSHLIAAIRVGKDLAREGSWGVPRGFGSGDVRLRDTSRGGVAGDRVVVARSLGHDLVRRFLVALLLDQPDIGDGG
jgi:hypothetical protein